MPYSPEHREKTRARIVECARVLFNRHGYENVTINMVMEAAELTRGGFYNHFKSKEELFAAAVSNFLMGRGAAWRADAGIDPSKPTREAAAQMLCSYLSDKHLGDLDGQCPMIALPSDVGRSGPEVQAAYQLLLEAMVGLFESSLTGPKRKRRETALALAALSVGGMVLARTLPDSTLASAVRTAAHKQAVRMLES
ncbi:MAG TPA: TetR/AcrR family transcriptional regulator [Vitreimonas sp.]|uniref:TetR/AcrR family transcriptional regulator n=1 Tax=Vitreimonas sp. TaxID=3069702 RepID=UPI002D44B7EF|nr:TetR/AcrR family transcriptional regulator [Vitreimonas sp.]HYD88613.1 TetR/AcrR family transcriptional regulator [Vitreimonas sp.]